MRFFEHRVFHLIIAHRCCGLDHDLLGHTTGFGKVTFLSRFELRLHVRTKKFSKRWQVQGDVFNLFNRKDHDIDYAHESRIKDQNGVLQDALEENHFHPVEKRAARLTLSGTF